MTSKPGFVSLEEIRTQVRNRVRAQTWEARRDALREAPLQAHEAQLLEDTHEPIRPPDGPEIFPRLDRTSDKALLRTSVSPEPLELAREESWRKTIAEQLETVQHGPHTTIRR